MVRRSVLRAIRSARLTLFLARCAVPFVQIVLPLVGVTLFYGAALYVGTRIVVLALRHGGAL